MFAVRRHVIVEVRIIIGSVNARAPGRRDDSYDVLPIRRHGIQAGGIFAGIRVIRRQGENAAFIGEPFPLPNIRQQARQIIVEQILGPHRIRER